MKLKHRNLQSKIETETIIFDNKAYNLNSIKKASYKFTREASIKINITPDGSFAVEFIFPKGILSSDKQQILEEFRNEVLDQDLREIISKETDEIKCLIMANAFSQTSLVE